MFATLLYTLCSHGQAEGLRGRSHGGRGGSEASEEEEGGCGEPVSSMLRALYHLYLPCHWTRLWPHASLGWNWIQQQLLAPPQEETLSQAPS